ncbi:hypothetical protein QOT17_001778 [Balamuthia mandrillaris]
MQKWIGNMWRIVAKRRAEPKAVLSTMYGGKHVQDATWTLIKAIENQGIFSKEWKQGVVIPLHKAGDPPTLLFLPQHHMQGTYCPP